MNKRSCRSGMLRRRRLSRALWIAVFALALGNRVALGETSAGAAPSSAVLPGDHALVVLDTLDMRSFDDVVAMVWEHGGEVPQAYPPNAFIAKLNPGVERALSRHHSVTLVERSSLDATALANLRGQAETAAHIWNAAFQTDASTAARAPMGPAPQAEGPDFLIPRPEAPGRQGAPDAPRSAQTSEFMAGKIVYTVVFVESNGGPGHCSPADPQSENWRAAQRNTVLAEISQGLAFWTSRANSPRPLTFMLDNQGIAPTSCEPIARPASDEGLWIADALTNLGRLATPSNYFSVARSFAHSRRLALGADWGFIVFMVNSRNDVDGEFSDGTLAYAYLNGPFTVLSYDNGDWGIGRLNLVALHETGHIFGALDEYAASECSPFDSWGYLNAANTSCNNGGIASDVSVMGEGFELDDPAADVSKSARDALGWRNPAGRIVDVVRTATVTLKRFAPDPTADRTPTFSGVARNQPFQPGGCNTILDICSRTPSPVTISKVRSVQWRLDGGSFTRQGVSANDGAFDEQSGEGYGFTPPSAVPIGRHTFIVRSMNHFGHRSPPRQDVLTIQRNESRVTE